MPIPAEHLKHLTYLVQAHQMFVTLGTDKKILAALNELSENPELRKQVAKDPAAYVKSKGISLPKGAKVTLAEGSWKISIEVQIGDHNFGASASYDSKSGFNCNVHGK
jgi:hypothetical protein